MTLLIYFNSVAYVDTKNQKKSIQFWFEHLLHLSKFGVALLEWSQKEDHFDNKIWHFRKNNGVSVKKGYNIFHYVLSNAAPTSSENYTIITASYYSLSKQSASKYTVIEWEF